VWAVWRSDHALFDNWRAIGRKTGIHFADRALGITGRFYKWTGAALGTGLAKKNKKGMTDVSRVH
jgi:hypothetical protein